MAAFSLLLPFQNLNWTTIFIILSFLIVSSYTVYLQLLPKPIPGIAYNEKSVKRLMGDIPSLLEEQGQFASTWRWMGYQCTKLNSPIIQLWIAPFQKPIVVLSDYREAADISLRRNKEFGRTELIKGVFGPVFDDFHMLMDTDDPNFKRHRRWLQDLMTPSFLHNVAAEPVYQGGLGIMAVWEQKRRLAKDRPFSTFKDIYFGALDAVFAFTFGGSFAYMSLPGRVEHFTQMSSDAIQQPADTDGAVSMEEPDSNEVVAAILGIADTVVSGRSTLLPPRVLAWFVHRMPTMRKYFKIRKNLINDEIHASLKRRENEDALLSALDFMVRREAELALKEQRQPDFYSLGMHSELFGFLMAGHETSATTFGWGVKFLADNQQQQAKLREALRKSFADATAEQRQPTSEEIVNTRVPYLDATLEEIVRLAGTTTVTDRRALCDTQVLGKRIPKDTTIVFYLQGESIEKPAFKIPDALRSKSALEAQARATSWEDCPYPPTEFYPERWLAPSKGNPEEVEFNSLAGPHMAFGLGTRACFGRRLAYLELRMFTVLSIWNYKLLPCPEKLSGNGGIMGLTVIPKDCYVKLAKAEW